MRYTWKVVKNIIFSLTPLIVLILLTESVLRIFFGLPSGIFRFLASGKNSLYIKNSTLPMIFGPIHYTIKTNSLGFRGRDIPLQKPENKIRIIALGDSITDGFFVDDEATYPYLLEQKLNIDEELFEVINAAKGGGSIDKAFAILRNIAAPLKPDIVLLTYCTNDICDIKGKSRDYLITAPMQLNYTHNRLLSNFGQQGITIWFISRTAIGEILMDTYLKKKYKGYSAFKRDKKHTLTGNERYNIPGGSDYDSNLEIFRKRIIKENCTTMIEPFSEETVNLIENYLYALEHVNNYCLQNNICFILVYKANYHQIYDLNASLKIRDILREKCKEISISFFDLTEPLRDIGRQMVLHLAPVDFHFNPAGNGVIAQEVAKMLKEYLSQL